MLEIEVKDDQVVALTGRLDASQVSELKQVLEPMTGAVTVDMAQLNYVSSAGLGVLIATHSRLKESGGSIRVVNANDLVRNIFRLSRLDQVIPVE